MKSYWQLYHTGPKTLDKFVAAYATRQSALRVAREIMKQPGEVGDSVFIGFLASSRSPYWTNCADWKMTATGWIKKM